jgi:hypothetical protein
MLVIGRRRYLRRGLSSYDYASFDKRFAIPGRIESGETMPDLNEIASSEVETTVANADGPQSTAENSDARNLAPQSRSRTRVPRKFPPLTFEEAILLPNLIQQIAAGQKVRRLTLFEHLNQSPDSNKSRKLVTASAQYGLTVGSYQAEYLELTPEGKLSTAEDVSVAQRFEARFNLAIKNIGPFNILFEKFQNNKVPVRDVMVDSLDGSVEPEDRGECVDAFIVNLKFLGMLRTIAGSERILTFDHALDDAKRAALRTENAGSSAEQAAARVRAIGPIVQAVQEVPSPAIGQLNGTRGEFSNTCFYITPIGEDDSEARRHADFIMEYIVKPAAKEFGLNVIRADLMGKPGMIGKQVIDHILNARVVIADLSFHNPNVFYEICLRHTTRLPIVQIIRASDKIPFDVNQYRTIPIETRDPYTLVPKLQTYVAEVANQIRRALEDEELSDNPISLYYPSAKLEWNGKSQ